MENDKLATILSLLGHVEIFKTSYQDLNKTAHITFADDSIGDEIDDKYFALLKSLEKINGSISEFHQEVLSVATQVMADPLPESKVTKKKEVPLSPPPPSSKKVDKVEKKALEETVRKNKDKNKLVVNILDYLEERLEEKEDDNE